MTTILTDRRTPQPDAPDAGHPGNPVPPEPEQPPKRSRRGVAVAGAFALMMAAFAAHLAVYGAWIVDDAGIPMAYAVNLAHGHGLVAQSGAAAVEGFSNPLWVAVFAALTKVGLFGKAEIFGLPNYVVVTKGLALVLQAVVLGSLAVVIRRVLVVVRGDRPTFGLFLASWTGAGLLLAANPSDWLVWSGLGGNPKLQADYVEVFVDDQGAQESVRRDTLARSENPTAVLETLSANAQALVSRRGASTCSNAHFN